MTVAEQRFARSEMALRQTGYMALIQSLGYADAIRFLLQLSPGEGDYAHPNAEGQDVGSCASVSSIRAVRGCQSHR